MCLSVYTGTPRYSRLVPRLPSASGNSLGAMSNTSTSKWAKKALCLSPKHYRAYIVSVIFVSMVIGHILIEFWENISSKMNVSLVLGVVKQKS